MLAGVYRCALGAGKGPPTSAPADAKKGLNAAALDQSAWGPTRHAKGTDPGAVVLGPALRQATSAANAKLI